MNDFEKYIQKNKKQLEPETVNPEVWLTIENQILQAKNKRKTLYLKVVSVAAVFLLGLFLFKGNVFQGESNSEKELLAKYGLEKYNFTQQVNMKKQALSKAMIPTTTQEDFKVLLQQLEFLDKQYHDYLKYIEKNGYQEFIGTQILNYYKSKIELLDKIQKEIQKINYYENKYPSDEKKVGLQI